MSRQKLFGSDTAKVSLLLTPELHRQIEDIAARRKRDKSSIIRHLLELGLAAERQGHETSPNVTATVSPHGGEHEKAKLTICLTAELWACVELAAKLHGLQPAVLVQQIVGEHIAACITKGRERQEEFRCLVNEKQQTDCRPTIENS